MTDAGNPEERSGLQKLMDSVSGSKGEASSWPVTVFLLGILVLILAVVGIKMALTKRRAAELARKLREQEESIKVAKENERLAANDEARRDAQEVIKDLEGQITELRDEMDVRKINHEDYVKELQAVSGWDDIVVVDKRDP